MPSASLIGVVASREIDLLSYTSAMLQVRRLALSTLHSAFMVLLVLGVLSRPLMSDVATLHGVAHSQQAATSAVAATESHHHVSQAVEPTEHGHHRAGQQSDDGDHASGTHAVMHYCGVGASTVALHIAMRVPSLVAASAAPRIAVDGDPRFFRPGPFRPPIA